MIHVFYKNRNTIGQFMVALIFLGTFGFLFTYDGFVAESTATSCCSGGEAAVTSFAADSSGDYGSDIPMDAEPTAGCGDGTDNPSESSGYNCSCLSAYNTDCGSTCTESSNCNSETKRKCEGACYNSDTSKPCKKNCCDAYICDKDSRCGGGC